jgi:hypothetical protein
MLAVSLWGETNYLKAGQKVSEARRTKVRERKRTLQHVDAKRADATNHMSLFQRPVWRH